MPNFLDAERFLTSYGFLSFAFWNNSIKKSLRLIWKGVTASPFWVLSWVHLEKLRFDRFSLKLRTKPNFFQRHDGSHLFYDWNETKISILWLNLCTIYLKSFSLNFFHNTWTHRIWLETTSLRYECSLLSDFPLHNFRR